MSIQRFTHACRRTNLGISEDEVSAVVECTHNSSPKADRRNVTNVIHHTHRRVANTPIDRPCAAKCLKESESKEVHKVTWEKKLRKTGLKKVVCCECKKKAQ